MTDGTTERARLDLDFLESVAKTATPGPWNGHDFGYPGMQEPSNIVVYAGEKFDWQAVHDGEYLFMTGWDHQEAEDVAFICAANPQTVLALIAEIRRLRDAREATND